MCQGVAESSDSRQTDGQTDNDLSNKCALRYQPKGNHFLKQMLQNSYKTARDVAEAAAPQ